MTPSIIELIKKRLGGQSDRYLIPPPVFSTMHGELVAFDSEDAVLTTRFPVLEQFLNPYGALQGGIVAAAVDNTLGPLSMLVAPPNVTRRLELKYSRPVVPELAHITVRGKLVAREGQKLTFRADVRDQEGALLARARAIHWITGDTAVEGLA